MRKFLYTFLITLFYQVSLGQELNCTVKISGDQIQGIDKRVFETLQTSILEFLNNTKWTNDAYTSEERIECSMFININRRISTDEFEATIQVQSHRPVYKTSYNSLLLNYNDNQFQFRYLEYQSLEFSLNTFTSNLTSVLAYYAYMIIGLDYDSFSLEGGTPYFQKAQTIVANSQNVKEEGWKAYESDKNRYWFVQNLLTQTFKPLRESSYRYHRKGLDSMTEDIEAARAEIAATIESLKSIHKIKPGSYNMQVFFNAKSDEIVNVFSQAFPDKKQAIVQSLNEIDPGNSNKYQKILSEN